MAETTQESLVIQVVSKQEDLGKRILALAESCSQEMSLSCKVLTTDPSIGLAEDSPQAVLIDLDSMAEDEALVQIQGVRRKNPATWILVTCQNPSLERLLKALRMGANDYLSAHPSAKEFQDTLIRRARNQNGLGARPQGKLVVVFGNKGGVGTTLLAVNVAATLVAQGERVALVDLVLQHGDLLAFLDLPTPYAALTLPNLIADLDQIDPDSLRNILAKHASGISVLPTPYAPQETENITAAQVSRLLEKFRSSFSAVVVDAGREFTDLALAALDAADRILLVTLPTLPAIRNTRRYLEVFGSLHYDPSKILIVVNRYDAKGALDLGDIEQALGQRVHGKIPNDYDTAVRALHQGVSVRTVQPEGSLATGLDRFVARFLSGRLAARPPSPSKETGVTDWLQTLLKRMRNGTA